MKQIISKDGKIFCETSTPYPKEVIKQIKNAGYKVKEVEETTENKDDK